MRQFGNNEKVGGVTYDNMLNAGAFLGKLDVTIEKESVLSEFGVRRRPSPIQKLKR